MRPSARLGGVPEYPFARWASECRAAEVSGLDVIRLDVGNPDLPPPPSVVEAAIGGLRSPSDHGYPDYRGRSELRHEICAYYERRFAVRLDPDDEVACLLGSKEGIVHLAQAILDPGDVVLLPDLGYTPYEAGAGLSQATIVRFPLRAEREYLPDFDAIPADVADRAKILWLNYPNNPTGAVADRGTFARAVAFAREHNVLLCHDTPYADIRYGACRPPSLLEVDGSREVALEFGSLSKTYNMAGWRIGYAVGHAEALALLRRLKTNVDSGMFTPLQRAAVAALCTDDAWIEDRNAVYQDRLAQLSEALRSIGLDSTPPRATHYLWTRLPSGEPCETFAGLLLRETGVAVAPGTFFGPGGEGFVRLSATASTERIYEAADRIAVWSRAHP